MDAELEVDAMEVYLEVMVVTVVMEVMDLEAVDMEDTVDVVTEGMEAMAAGEAAVAAATAAAATAAAGMVDAAVMDMVVGEAAAVITVATHVSDHRSAKASGKANACKTPIK